MSSVAAFGPIVYLAWRRLVRPPWALAIGVIASLLLVEPYKIDRARLEFADLSERVVEIRAHVPMASWAFTLVRDDMLEPDRPFLDPPPAAPPAEVRAIDAAAQRR